MENLSTYSPKLFRLPSLVCFPLGRWIVHFSHRRGGEELCASISMGGVGEEEETPPALASSQSELSNLLVVRKKKKRGLWSGNVICMLYRRRESLCAAREDESCTKGPRATPFIVPLNINASHTHRRIFHRPKKKLSYSPFLCPLCVRSCWFPWKMLGGRKKDESILWLIILLLLIT